MPRDEMERIRAGMELFNRRDAEAIVAECHPEVEFMTSIAQVEGEGGIYRGLDGINQWLREVEDAFDYLRGVLGELHEVGPDTYLGEGRVLGRGKGSGVTFDIPFFWVIRAREGKLGRWEGHLNRDSALESVGLDAWPGA